MAKRSSFYKSVNMNSVDMGSAGEPVRIGRIQKIDAEGLTGYANNVVFTSYIQDYQQPAGGVPGQVNPPPSILISATTSSTWDANDLITARATTGAGTVSLALRRVIRRNTDVDDGNDGLIHIYAELTDTTVSTDLQLKFVSELWGRYVQFVEVN